MTYRVFTLIRAYFPWSGYQPFYKKFYNNFFLDFFWSFWYSVSKWMALRLSKKLGKCKGSTRRNNVMSFLLSMFFAGSFWRIACSSICVHNHDNQRGDGYILCLHSKSKNYFIWKTSSSYKLSAMLTLSMLILGICNVFFRLGGADAILKVFISSDCSWDP